MGIPEAMVQAEPASVERSAGEDDVPRAVVDRAPLAGEVGVLRLELLLSLAAVVEAMVRTEAHRISWRKIPCKQEMQEVEVVEPCATFVLHTSEYIEYIV
jgi:hypothetical protein